MFGGLAQLVERLLCKQDVSGSSPLTSTPTVLPSQENDGLPIGKVIQTGEKLVNLASNHSKVTEHLVEWMLDSTLTQAVRDQNSKEP